jgi:hypothetical protein
MGPLRTFSKDPSVGKNKRAVHQRHMRTVTTVPLQPTRHILSLSTPQGLTSAHRGAEMAEPMKVLPTQIGTASTAFVTHLSRASTNPYKLPSLALKAER